MDTFDRDDDGTIWVHESQVKDFVDEVCMWTIFMVDGFAYQVIGYAGDFVGVEEVAA